MGNLMQRMVGLFASFVAGWAFAASNPPPISGAISTQYGDFQWWVLLVILALLFSWAGER